jgi:SAM-dependent methyltransferase
LPWSAEGIVKVPRVYGETFFSKLNGDSLRSAEVIVPILYELVQPQSVVDVGCGVGAWLSVFKKHGASRTLGIDGDYVPRDQLLVEAHEFSPVDLGSRFHLNETFDLAVCLEVAEHLPRGSARAFIDSITRLAPCVLFSAALPGQMGINHINLQWPDYWERLFHDAGFVSLDPIRPRIWQDTRVAWWYRQGCQLYVDAELIEADEELTRLAEIRENNNLMLIHRGVLTANLSLGHSLRRVPRQLVSLLLKLMRLQS